MSFSWSVCVLLSLTGSHGVFLTCFDLFFISLSSAESTKAKAEKVEAVVPQGNYHLIRLVSSSETHLKH